MNFAKSDLLRYLALSEAAYTTELPPGFAPIARITADPAKAHALIDPADRDFGFVARELATGAIHVWFRGTREKAEWLDDAAAVLVKHPQAGMVHAGFYGLFAALVQSVVLAVPLGAPALIFGGHSLGAPLATYAALGFRRAQLVTFEGPRPGDGAFADFVEQNTSIHLRIVNHADIVPHLPPRPLFSHAGGCIGFLRPSADLHVAHSLELSVAPAIASMPDLIEASPNQR